MVHHTSPSRQLCSSNLLQIYSKEFSIEMSTSLNTSLTSTTIPHPALTTLMQIFFAEFDISFSSKEPVLALLHTNSDLMHLFVPKHLVRFPNCHECQYSSIPVASGLRPLFAPKYLARDLYTLDCHISGNQWQIFMSSSILIF